MPAEFEEVVVGADLVDAEDVGEDLAQDLLGLGARCASTEAGRGLRFGQGAGVELAVDGHRHGVDELHSGRDHVVGQLGTQVCDEPRGQIGRITISHRNGVSGKSFRARHERVVDGDHRGGADLGMLLEHGRDLVQFDAVAADLDLVVDAAEIVEVAVGPSAHEVARAVHATTGRPRVGDEPVGGEAEAVQIAAGETDTGDVQLADDTVDDGPQPRVEDVGAGRADRDADRGGRAVVGATAEGVDRVLGGAVEVVPEVPSVSRRRVHTESDTASPPSRTSGGRCCPGLSSSMPSAISCVA